MDFPILSWIIFLPLVGAIILFFIPKEKLEQIRVFSFSVTLLDFIFSVPLFFFFEKDIPDMQFEENIVWIKEYGISYHVGIDGISLFLILLTTFLAPIVILSSWRYIEERVKEYMIFMLILETGMLGTFMALDLFLFYVFWEVTLVPMYFIIGVWGGPQKIYAAVKFIIYTMLGSLLMLVGILFLYYFNFKVKGVLTFDLLELYQLSIPRDIQIWLFLAFGLAFAIKVPMFPFHTWLPDAHVEAPTGGSVILAAILLKMGTYGFLRFAIPLFPHASMEFIPLISILAIIGIIYGAWVSMVQPDLKKLVAYSSVSHLGYVMLGFFTLNIQGIEGGIYQMLNHGLSTGALFLIVGIMYERRHTRLIEEFGGLSNVIPVFAAIFMIVTLSSIGLPGLNNFVGEFLILVGTFKANKIYAVFAASGMIWGAVYMLWMYQRVMFGRCHKAENRAMWDLSLREKAYLLPIVIMIFLMGIYPQPFLRRMDASVNHLLNNFKERVIVIEKVERKNPNSQIQNPNEIPNPKSQILIPNSSLGFGHWDLGF